MILVIDNYDSFTFNLVQILGELGEEMEVVRNDEINLQEAAALDPDGILISPGPGRPADAGISEPLIRQEAEKRPILGICLGHQAIAEVYGGRIGYAPELVHGKTSLIEHEGRGVLEGLPNPFPATRYHSLIVEEEGLPAELEVTARAEGLIMGIQHRRLPVFGVQFHPESILTSEPGRRLLENFVRLCREGRPHGVQTVS